MNIESDTKILDKKQNADQILNNPIYSVLVGIVAAKKGLFGYIIRRNYQGNNEMKNNQLTSESYE